MKIVKASYHKNPFIGLFLKTNNSITLVPKQSPAKIRQVAKEALNTTVLEMFVNQSPLIGLLTALNDNGCVLANQSELEEVRLLKKQGLNVYVMEEQYAPGNTIFGNKKATIISPLISRHEAEKIAECLGTEFIQESVGSIKTIGAINVATNKGLLAYNDITEVELKKLEKILGVHGEAGTNNTGTPFNSLGVIANDYGALIGDLTTGFESQRIYQALCGE